MSNVSRIVSPSPPSELRELLIKSAMAVLDRQLTPAQANAIASLSSEVHKSIKMQMVGEMMSCKSEPLNAEYVVTALGGGRS
jgi:hypothetical protein